MTAARGLVAQLPGVDPVEPGSASWLDFEYSTRIDWDQPLVHFIVLSRNREKVAKKIAKEEINQELLV